MQVMPHICSQPGLFVMHIFRYLFLYCLMLTICKYFTHHFYVMFVQGRRGRGAGGPWPTLEFRSSDFSEILRFRRKITDFGLALSTFDQFRLFHRFQFFPQHLLFSLLLRRHFPDIAFVLGSVYTLCTRASKKLRRSCTIKGHCFGRHC